MKKTFIPLAILSLGAAAALAWSAVWLSMPGRPIDTVFSVAAGDSTDKIIGGLKDRGFIRSRWIFRYILSQSGLAARLQPGDYDLVSVDSYGDIIAKLTTGGLPANEFVLLVKEGWDLRDIRNQLALIGYAEADGLYRVTGSPAADYGPAGAGGPPSLAAKHVFLRDKPADVGLEGFLFPDTYRFFRDASTTDIVGKMLDNFGRKFDTLRADLTASGKSVFEVVTMASIVENEVRGDEDRRLAADIFWRRLAAGMPLQADSTVNYVTGKSLPAVTAKDTEAASRFNTYAHRGLPLGPIGNPGLSALSAVLHPQKNAYWYFLTDAEGRVHYGRTLDEHNANKARYLR